MNCVQLEVFPIDSNTLAWVRRMIILDILQCDSPFSEKSNLSHFSVFCVTLPSWVMSHLHLFTCVSFGWQVSEESCNMSNSVKSSVDTEAVTVQDCILYPEHVTVYWDMISLLKCLNHASSSRYVGLTLVWYLLLHRMHLCNVLYR